MADNYTDQWAGEQIFNQPQVVLEDTGFYHVDFYGCWHLLTVIAVTAWLGGPRTEHAIGDEFYMIGQYPEEHYFPVKLTP